MQSEKAKPDTFSRIGVFAAQIAVALPVLGALWWYADFVYLSTGWLHPYDFPEWDVLLFPFRNANTPFTQHPAYWGQIVLTYIVSLMWMLCRVFQGKRWYVFCIWLLPACATLPGFVFSFVLAFSGALYFMAVGLMTSLLYAQPLAILIYASRNRTRAILLSAAAMVTVLPCVMISTFDVAHQADHHHAVQRLLSYGMSPNARNASGATLLHEVVLGHEDEVYRSVDLLLRSGADPNIQDAQGTTPLLQLITMRFPLQPCYPQVDVDRAWKQLIAAGANPDIKDKDGHSARSLRITKEHELAKVYKQP